MKCSAMQKKKKPRMTSEEREAWDALNKRYYQLRMRMSHKAAMEQLKKEFGKSEEEPDEQRDAD